MKKIMVLLIGVFMLSAFSVYGQETLPPLVRGSIQDIYIGLGQHSANIDVNPHNHKGKIINLNIMRSNSTSTYEWVMYLKNAGDEKLGVRAVDNGYSSSPTRNFTIPTSLPSGSEIWFECREKRSDAWVNYNNVFRVYFTGYPTSMSSPNSSDDENIYINSAGDNLNVELTETNSNDAKIYPNPVKASSTLTIEKEDKDLVEIYDFNGRKVKSTYDGTIVAPREKGQYVLKVGNNTSTLIVN